MNVFANFSEDGKKLATGGFGTSTILWETETLKQLVKMSGRTNMAYEVAFSADGTHLSSGGRTRWDLRTGRGSRLTALARRWSVRTAEPGWKIGRRVHNEQ